RRIFSAGTAGRRWGETFGDTVYPKVSAEGAGRQFTAAAGGAPPADFQGAILGALQRPVGSSDHVFERRAREIAARVVPPQLAPAAAADVRRHQHVGQIPERAFRGQRLARERVEPGAEDAIFGKGAS